MVLIYIKCQSNLLCLSLARYRTKIDAVAILAVRVRDVVTEVSTIDAHSLARRKAAHVLPDHFYIAEAGPAL